MKCSVCFENLKETDSRGLDYYVCSYCGTRQPKFLSQDFDKRNIISNINKYLNDGNLTKARRTMNYFESSYPNDDSPEYTNMKEIVDSGIIYANINPVTYKSKSNSSRGTAIVLLDYDRFINNKGSIIDNFKNNTIIQDSLNKIYDSCLNIKSKSQSVLFLSSNTDYTNKIIDDLSYNVIYLDLDSDNVEANVIKNIDEAKGLGIYCGQENFLTNSYVLNVLNRFRNKNKPIFFLYSDDFVKNDAFEYPWINVADSDRNRKITNTLNNQSIDKILYKNDGSEIVQIEECDRLVIPTFITSIKSRCAYKKQIKELEIPNKNKFHIKERAFESATIEELYVKENDCELNIDTNAFINAKSLRKVVLYSLKNTIGIGAFKNCISLNTLELANNTKTVIFDHAFENTAINSLQLKGDVLIKRHAFRDTLVSKLEISSDCKIEDYAFNKEINVIITGGNMNGNININAFPKGTNITIIGKDYKSYYSYLIKNCKDYYQINLKK